MSQVRIGLAQFLAQRTGSVALPEEVTLCCPRCGEETADKGRCIVELQWQADKTSRTGFSARLSIDCRSCGCTDAPPGYKPPGYQDSDV